MPTFAMTSVSISSTSSQLSSSTDGERGEKIFFEQNDGDLDPDLICWGELVLLSIDGDEDFFETGDDHDSELETSAGI